VPTATIRGVIESPAWTASRKMASRRAYCEV
jgi:hypothetical protein